MARVNLTDKAFAPAGCKADDFDEGIVEIMGHVALNLFTEDVNAAFVVPVDFPSVKLIRAA
jgi:hypothetical protein